VSAEVEPRSLFDSLRHVDQDGAEWWSARDLMGPLGYDSWRRFADAIDRAKITAKNQGMDVTGLFAGAVKNPSAVGGRPAEDVHLARFAAYLVAMNGDPRKPEIAAAQSYFAIRTREAETQTMPTGKELLALAVLEADRTIKEKEAQIAELAPRATKWDAIVSAAGDLSVSDTAKLLCRAGLETGPQRLFNELIERRWLFRAGDGRPRPLQWAMEQGLLSTKAQGPHVNRKGQLTTSAPQVRVTPKGLDRLLDMHGLSRPLLEVAA
jgi:phage antirepressor YoqD-like protein